MDLIRNNGKCGAVTIPRCKLVQKAMIEAALKTHEMLSEEDINYALEQIIPINLTDKELALFILQIYKLGNTGRFSLTYNLSFHVY